MAENATGKAQKQTPVNVTGLTALKYSYIQLIYFSSKGNVMFLVFKSTLRSVCAVVTLGATLFSSASAMIEIEKGGAAHTSTALIKYQGLQVTRDYPADLNDCLDVALNLHRFNKHVLGDVFQAELRVSSNNTLLGEVYQDSIVIDDDVLDPLCDSSEKLHALLYDIEQVAHFWGVEKAYISCPENTPLPLCLVNEGFRVVTPCPDFEKGQVRICLTKELTEKIDSSTAQDIIFHPDGEHSDDEWAEFFRGDITKLPNRFGVFLRENGTIKGGVWAHFWNPEEHDDGGIPHAFIHVLWVDDALKGQGWGKVLMREIEELAINKGARYLQLDTNTFQAPYFYQKLGFQLREIRPHDVTAQGMPSSLFMCTKKLFENPLTDRGLMPYYNFLTGSQFFLRPLFPEDYAAFLPVFMDADQMKYLGYGKPITIERAKQYVQEQAVTSHSPNPKMFSWSVVTHQGIAGRIFLTAPTPECPEKELGYFISPAFAGRGLTTEASRLAMSFMEGPYVATVHPLNFGSVAVLKKLGFKADPNRLGVPKFGSVRDYYLLSDL